MLTEGDRVKVVGGDHAGHTGSVEMPTMFNGGVGVALDNGAWVAFASDRLEKVDHDPVSTPSHYRSHPSGIECIQITEHMGFNLGNATKYIWRADLKGNAIEDLRKAAWYINREIEKREAS